MLSRLEYTIKDFKDRVDTLDHILTESHASLESTVEKVKTMAEKTIFTREE